MMSFSLIHFWIVNCRNLLFLLFSMVFLSNSGNAQNQIAADSLEKIYNSGTKGKQNLDVLKGLAENSIAPYKKLKFSEELLAVARKKDSNTYIYSGLLQKGNALVSMGNFSRALESYFQAASIAKTERELGLIKVTLGDVYSLTDNHSRSIKYYNENDRSNKKS